MSMISMIMTILLLSLLGVLIGVLLSVAAKKRRSGSLNDLEKLSETELRRLAQLKGQLDSGLISKEEYQAERKKLLRT